MNSLKPVVEDINTWNTCKEILYKYPRCDISFRILGNREKFCHNCGQEINWNNIPKYLTEPYYEQDFKRRNKFLKDLNTLITSMSQN